MNIYKLIASFSALPGIPIRLSYLRLVAIMLLIVGALGRGSGQQASQVGHSFVTQNAFSNSPDQPVGKIGVDDLLGVTVYDSPEQTKTVRVAPSGDIGMPMVRKRIHAAGLYPPDLEQAISKALVEEGVLVNPTVTVSVIEYRSRPVTVVGAVKTPLTFQATGRVTLLDAISRAGGLTENAGADILISQKQGISETSPAPLVLRVPVHDLIDGTNLALNLYLNGGEEIRVPEAGRVFVLGNVKRPGSFPITDSPTSSVLKALALCEGLNSFSARLAYIYRDDGASGGRREIPVELKQLMARKSPDVPLLANDILYVPSATGARASVKVLEASAGLAAVLGAALVYTTR